MNPRNIRTVCLRELRDQLRDRRTLFMVAVLPLLMYPLMGMMFSQLAQFIQSNRAEVLLLGADQLGRVDGLPELLEGERFAASLGRPDQINRLTLSRESEAKDAVRAAKAAIGDGRADVAVLFPAGFAEQLTALQAKLEAIGGGGAPGDVVRAPKPLILYNSADDASRLAYYEVERLLDRWRKQIVGSNLAASGVPAGVVDPFRLASQDVAKKAAKQASLWAKLLPFVVFVWALTGAFYPAVDLCAGEKERGTLETLLVSPASRVEIVWGKLLTVITFSMVTALLNLVVIAATGTFVLQQFAAAGAVPGSEPLGQLPLGSLVWLVIALPPVAALFSALAFACAAFARSTKEGQYYFMPLFLGVLPLMVMPLAPGVELNLGTSLAPVMGLVLLLRSLMEGEFLTVWPYGVPVTIVTGACCLLAIRWAVSQFNQESVLFRGDDRFDLKLWLAGLFRRSEATPTVTQAVVCVAAILILQFVVVNTIAQRMPPPGSGFWPFAGKALLSQAMVLLPAFAMGLLLVRDGRRTFLLDPPRRPAVILAAVGLAVLLHPAAVQLQVWIRQLYPLAEGVMAQLKLAEHDLSAAPSPWLLVVLIGLVPAVAEELTFRGFVLTGLRRSGSTGWAIAISAVAFGVVHTVLQQSLSAAVFGAVLGYLAVVTRSLFPCLAYHATHNSLPLLIGMYQDWAGPIGGEGERLRAPAEGAIGYDPWITAGSLVLAIVLLRWIRSDSAATGSPPAGVGQPSGPAVSPSLASPDSSLAGPKSSRG